MNLSGKLFNILKTQTDLTDSDLSQLSEAEGWKLVYSLRPPKKVRLNEICFTGFGYSANKELTIIAEENNFHVVKSVTVKLDFLCCGENPGPSKMAKAKNNCSHIIDEEEFRELIETGEIPSIE